MKPGEELAEARAAARDLFDALAGGSLSLVLAESCTGGLMAALFTELPGSSALLWGGLVVYGEEAKARLLGVRRDTLAARGAVSAETAAEMASGALGASGADLAIAVTGYAGPGAPGSEGGPGRVLVAVAPRGEAPRVEERRLEGDRGAVRAAAAAWAFRAGLAAIGGTPRY